MADKIYCGNGKEKKFDNGGSIVSITVDIETLQRNFAEYGFTTEQGKKKMRLDVSERRAPDNYGNTHAVTVNTWKPDGAGQGQSQPEYTPENPPPADELPSFDDDIPI